MGILTKKRDPIQDKEIWIKHSCTGLLIAFLEMMDKELSVRETVRKNRYSPIPVRA